MNMRVLFYSIFILFFSNLYAQDPLLLSLKKAEDLAIQNNYNLNAGLHRLEQGYYGYRASKDYFLPNLTLTAEGQLIRDHTHDLDSVLMLTQPLYDKVAFYNLKESQIQWEILRLDVCQQICDILFQVREAFYEMILHQSHLADDRMIIQIWEDELKRQKKLFELGSSIPYEVNQTQLHLKNAWIDLYATQKNIRTSQIKLLTILGLPPETSFELAEREIPLPPSNWQRGNLDQWKKWAFQFRPELKQEQFAFLLSQNKVKQTKAENYPTFNFYANVGQSYVNNGFDGQPYIGVGVNLDWMLYDPSNRHRIKQAQEGSREVACRYYQIELETDAVIHNSLNEIEQYYESYLAAQESSVLALEGMRLANKKQQLGEMSPFEYRDTIKTLHEAEQKINQAKFDLLNAYDRLIKQTGIDLSRCEDR